MTVESSEPMIFRPDTANSPEALALRELREESLIQPLRKGVEL